MGTLSIALRWLAFRHMPRLSPARAAARRQQIIDAALICFAERGFHKATLQDVVHASGLSPGSIYCHFAGKEDIVYAVVDARHRRDLQNLGLALNANTLDEALRLLADAFFPSSGRREDRAWRRLAVQLWAESHHDRTLLRAVREGFDTPRRKLTELLRRAKQRGELAQDVEPETTARVLIAVFQGVTLQQTWDENIDASSCVRVIQRILPRR
jgi:TetR/AcrR family transcriptional regulator, transcriptional repressor of aconitase